MSMLGRVRQSEMGTSVSCGECGAACPASLASEVPRPPCPECGSKALAFEVGIAEELDVALSISASFKPGDQSLGWSRRWEAAQSQLTKLLAPRTEGLSGEAIKDARDELLRYYVQTYHLKDALKVEAASLGLDKHAVESAVSEDPTLDLLGDLANQVKHHGMGRKPDRPEIVEARGTSGPDGWRLDLTIRHKGNDLDGLVVAQEAVATWGRLLAGWGLI